MTDNDRGSDPQRSTLTIPGDLAFIGMIQRFVRDYARLAGFGDTDLDRFDLVIEEAATNVIEGAFLPGERGTFDVSCERVPAGMRITVHDEGLPYDPSLAAVFDPSAELEQQTGAGLGSYLMHQLMDTVEFRNLGVHGKETVFTKYLEGMTVAATPPSEEGAAEKTRAHVPPAERATIEIGLLRPEQAIEVCRCIYDAYRYSYVNEHMYYPDRIVALNKSGDMISVVATTDSGEVAGHTALVFNDVTRDIADMAVAATKNKFRGQSVALRVGEYVTKEAQRRGLHGIFAEQVTVHTYTQRFCHKLGFGDCGFLLAYSPATMAFSGIAEASPLRRSVVLGYKYLEQPMAAPVYVPPHHRPIIERIYAGLGVAMEVRESLHTLGAFPLATSELNVSVNPRRSVATIRVHVYGRDLATRLREEVLELRRQEVRVIDVLLDMHEPRAGRVVEALEEYGFLFTGILPGGPSGDRLILQYFNGVAVNYDGMLVEREATQQLLAYIRANDPQTT